ncbi:hypothetical protein CXG50_12320 [Pseudomonas plecoglossicida]|uniref:hypothetical protein n=1 Tax=Pseudomonas TaxID=286 RepID=UPI0002A15AE3|nr:MULTISPECIES: hypothetical protein [Pseudomonas]AGA72982.1 hypothetical protein B479_10400 [Pseudomonas putida HB3267]MCE0946203.1 hypothetical protein [Pseudomonas asiatica]MCE1067188.1 hypothetical protein [Pseudomonas asiatica]MCE1101987.1 hypothetical protein [Pseudomonas asiatica]MCE1107521.1 hypothetical protein [Pseudomonas asiatica]
MGITIKKPEIDIDGQRWVDFAPGAKLLVASFGSPLFKSHKAIIQRHLDSIDAQTRAGTKDFSLESIAEIELESGDDLYFELAARHLIKDWQGVDVAENPGVPAEYSPKLGVALLKMMPDVYWTVVRAALDIMTRAKERAEATAEKQ